MTTVLFGIILRFSLLLRKNRFVFSVFFVLIGFDSCLSTGCKGGNRGGEWIKPEVEGEIFFFGGNF